MKLLICLFALLMPAYGIPPGLPIPKWYEGRIQGREHPTPDRSTFLDFQFHSLLGPLEKAHLEWHLPEGVIALHPENLSRSLPRTSHVSSSLEVRFTKPVPGLSINATLRLSTPYEELIQKALDIYSNEPSHAQKQIQVRIGNLRSELRLNFSLPLYLSEIEGRWEMPAPAWSLMKEGPLQGWLQWLPRTPLSLEELKSQHHSARQSLESLKSQPKALEKILSQAPGILLRLEQELSFSGYQIILKQLENQADPQELKKEISELTSQILKFHNHDYEMILALQSLLSLAKAISGDLASAISGLTDTTRTMTQSPSRAYLLFNLGILCLKASREDTARNYFQEAHRIQPGLFWAKKQF